MLRKKLLSDIVGTMAESPETGPVIARKEFPKLYSRDFEGELLAKARLMFENRDQVFLKRFRSGPVLLVGGKFIVSLLHKTLTV
jgi:hypothetical protein